MKKLLMSFLLFTSISTFCMEQRPSGKSSQEQKIKNLVIIIPGTRIGFAITDLPPNKELVKDGCVFAAAIVVAGVVLYNLPVRT